MQIIATATGCCRFNDLIMKKFCGSAFFLLLFFCEASAQNQNFIIINPDDTHEEIILKAAHVTPSPRQLRWQQLELTAFLHFGINTFTDREWGDGTEDAKLFQPKNLNAEQWVRICKEAGFKQIILTAKHHDGFCLWPSKFTEHSVKHSSWKKGRGDVVKEVADACHKYGVGFGVYLSPWDRNSVYYGDSATYNEYFINQLTELLTGYGRVDEVWFDGANGEGKNGKKQVYDFERWYQLIRKLQPQAVIAVMGPDVRWVGTETGYGRETEWSVLPLSAQNRQQIAAASQTDVAFEPKGDRTGEDLGSRKKLFSADALIWYPAETDVSIRPGWFYHEKENEKVKTPEKLLDIYFHSVGRNGVLLLNIPPDKNGLIHKTDSAALLRFKELREKLFARNLLQQAKVKSSNGKNRKALLDEKFGSYWTTKKSDTAAIITFRLKGPQTFDVLMLQENIAEGQRIEKFVLEAKVDNEWKTITEGTTVGYKRLLRFDPVTANSVRLKIISSRLNPTLSEVGVYYSK